MIKEQKSNGRTVTHGLPPNRVLAHGHSPFLILSEGPEEDETKQNVHTRNKRYVEISVDRNSFPNRILPSFASEKIEKNTLETQLGGKEIGGMEKFSVGKTGGGVSGKKMAEVKVGSQEGENEILPYPRFINDEIH